jgi:hypothetical protein
MMRLIGLLIATTLESGCATKEDWIDRTLVTVDVTGTWTGTVGGGPPGISTSLPDLLFELERQGSRVTGFMRLGENRHFGPLFRLFPGPMDGTVTGDIFRFQLKDGNLNGELKVSGDEMLGQVSLLGGRPLVLRRGDSSSPPSPPR